MTTPLRALLGVASALALAGCSLIFDGSDLTGGGADAAARDGGSTDAGAGDAGGGVDAGAPEDAGAERDAAAVDGGSGVDAAAPDAGPGVDAGLVCDGDGDGFEVNRLGCSAPFDCDDTDATVGSRLPTCGDGVVDPCNEPGALGLALGVREIGFTAPRSRVAAMSDRISATLIATTPSDHGLAVALASGGSVRLYRGSVDASTLAEDGFGAGACPTDVRAVGLGAVGGRLFMAMAGEATSAGQPLYTSGEVSGLSFTRTGDCENAFAPLSTREAGLVSRGGELFGALAAVGLAGATDEGDRFLLIEDGGSRIPGPEVGQWLAVAGGMALSASRSSDGTMVRYGLLTTAGMTPDAFSATDPQGRGAMARSGTNLWAAAPADGVLRVWRAACLTTACEQLSSVADPSTSDQGAPWPIGRDPLLTLAGLSTARFLLAYRTSTTRVEVASGGASFTPAVDWPGMTLTAEVVDLRFAHHPDPQGDTVTLVAFIDGAPRELVWSTMRTCTTE